MLWISPCDFCFLPRWNNKAQTKLLSFKKKKKKSKIHATIVSGHWRSGNEAGNSWEAETHGVGPMTAHLSWQSSSPQYREGEPPWGPGESEWRRRSWQFGRQQQLEFSRQYPGEKHCTEGESTEHSADLQMQMNKLLKPRAEPSGRIRGNSAWQKQDPEQCLLPLARMENPIIDGELGRGPWKVLPQW